MAMPSFSVCDGSFPVYCYDAKQRVKSRRSWCSLVPSSCFCLHLSCFFSITAGGKKVFSLFVSECFCFFCCCLVLFLFYDFSVFQILSAAILNVHLTLVVCWYHSLSRVCCLWRKRFPLWPRSYCSWHLYNLYIIKWFIFNVHPCPSFFDVSFIGAKATMYKESEAGQPMRLGWWSWVWEHNQECEEGKTRLQRNKKLKIKKYKIWLDSGLQNFLSSNDRMQFAGCEG